MSEEKAKCRGCGLILRGNDYCFGGSAYLANGDRAKINHYSGFVCSESCDIKSSRKLENSMPGATPTGNRLLSCFVKSSLNRNWGINRKL